MFAPQVMPALAYDRKAEQKCAGATPPANYCTDFGVRGASPQLIFPARLQSRYRLVSCRRPRLRQWISTPRLGCGILRGSLLAAVADTSKRRIGDRRRTAVNKLAQLSAFSSHPAGWTAHEALSPCVVKTSCNLRRWR
jgi:hypothetical protein